MMDVKRTITMDMDLTIHTHVNNESRQNIEQTVVFNASNLPPTRHPCILDGKDYMTMIQMSLTLRAVREK